MSTQWDISVVFIDSKKYFEKKKEERKKRRGSNKRVESNTQGS